MAVYTLEPVARAICEALDFSFGGGIGRGTFKETFLATTPEGTKIAVKVLKPGFSTERSEREVDAMKRCSHPNIVGLLQLADFEHGGTNYAYLTEAFMEGGTLEDRLKGGRMSRAETLILGEQLIRAVGHIAEKGLVHRDIKPANIMYLAPGGEAVIGDFGIVRDLGKESVTKSYLLRGPGTPFFAAPEQLNNEKVLIDWRTDQFAVGVTLAIAHIGSHPYRRPGESDEQAVARVGDRKGPDQEFLRASAAAGLPVLSKMVAAWPAQRVRTPDVLLKEWREQEVGD